MQMTRKERMLAAIHGQKVDRIPFGMWYHLPHVDQDPVSLAEEHLRIAEEYGLDFIKMMPFGNYQAADYGLSCSYYCTPTQAVFERKFAIEDVEEWAEIKALPGFYGHHGKVLMSAQQLAKQQKKRGVDIPFVQTVFSPLTIARKLAGDRIFADMKEHPALMHHALSELSKTCIHFVEENLNAGVSGFFFASQCASFDLMSEEAYKEFGAKYDVPVLEAAEKRGFLNIIHIHGENTMFQLLSSYPVSCVNWHDRWVAPTLAEARKITDKCLMGGINETWLHSAKPVEIAEHIRQAVEMGGREGFVLTPGCCASMETPKENILACKAALDTL